MGNFGADKSAYCMVIYLLDNTRKTYYSLVNEEKKGLDYCINKMYNRLLNKKYSGKYKYALVYDNKSKATEPIRRYNKDKRIQ